MARWLRFATVCFGFGVAGAAACGSTGTVAPAVPPLCLVYPGGGAPIPPPDGAAACAAGPCNYQTQQGCATNQTCTLKFDHATETVSPICNGAGTVGKGKACSVKAPCDRGLFCVENVCRKMCCGSSVTNEGYGDWTACDPGESCIVQVEATFRDGGPETYAGFNLCLPVNDCNVLDPKACASKGRICRIVNPTGAVACAPFADGQLGASCDHLHLCGAGLHCVGTEPADGGPTHKVCRKLCRWGACGEEPSCTQDQGSCVHFTRDPSGVGECTPNWIGKPLVTDGGPVDGSALIDPDASR